MPTSTTLVSAAQIARLAGVTRASVSNWRRRHPDFPTPAGGTPTRPAFDLDQVRAWLAGRDQLPPGSPADDLHAALHNSGDPAITSRLWPLLLAAGRIGDVELKAIAELADADLLARLSALASHAQQVPGATGTAYRVGDARPVRALLRCIRAEGAASAADVFAERDGSGAGGVPVTGAHATPLPLARLMADLLAEPDGSYPASVFDPACGSGRLLAAAAGRGAADIAGQDILDSQAAQAAVRLALANPQATVRVRVGDSLRDDALADLRAGAVLCNPPYGVRDWGAEDLAHDPRWVLGLPPKGEPELAWLQHCLAHLDDGGRAVLLLPPAVAERSSGRRIRAELLRAKVLKGVVALPPGAAPPPHIGLHLWLLHRPRTPAAERPDVLFVDTAAALDGGRKIDWEHLARIVQTTWHAWLTDADRFTPVPGTTCAVPIMELLDDLVDLTPARWVRLTPATATPEQHSDAAEALRTRVRRAAAGLATLSGGLPWPAAGSQPQQWRTATVADLLRGGALTLLARTSPPGDHLAPTTEPGDVVVAEVRRRPLAAQVATVVSPNDAGAVPRQSQVVLRPDQTRLDPWFLAGFLSSEDNLRAASSGTSVVRTDVRRLRIPLLPINNQRRYGKAFRQLRALLTAADLAARLVEETATTISAGLTSGTLLPPETPTDPEQAGEDNVGRA